MALVKFKTGTSEQFSGITKDNDTLYFLTDTQEIYKGSVKYSGDPSDYATLKAWVGYPNDSVENGLVNYIDNALEEFANSLGSLASADNASDISIADAGGYFTTDTVEAALQQLGNAVSTAGAVTITKTTGGASDDFVTKYTFSQNGSQITNGEITIGKDMVATSGALVQPTAQNPITIDGQQVTSGTYIAMTIANGTPFYINVADLIEYNQFTSNDEITFTDTNHNITATIGEIAASKITYGENTVASVLDNLSTTIGNQITSAIEGLDATVTATAAVSGTDDAEAVGVLTSVKEVDGVLSAVGTDGSTSVLVDAAGAATRAKNAVIGTSGDAASASTVYGAKAYTDAQIADLDSSVTATGAATLQHNGVLVLTGVTEADGKLTSATCSEVEAAGAAAAVLGTSGDAASASTVYGAKAYADSLLTWGTLS